MYMVEIITDGGAGGEQYQLAVDDKKVDDFVFKIAKGEFLGERVRRVVAYQYPMMPSLCWTDDLGYTISRSGISERLLGVGEEMVIPGRMTYELVQKAMEYSMKEENK
jgi:hypothetical protein